MPFCGATDSPVLDFLGRLLWVSKPEWAVLFSLGRGIRDIRSQRFTSSSAPVDLLVASMTAELFSFTYLRAGIDGAQNLFFCFRYKTTF